MKKLKFLTGNILFIEKKSGVEWFYYRLFESIIKNNFLDIEIYSFVSKKIKNKVPEIFIDKIKKIYFPLKFLKNKLICNWFSKNSDIYLMDGVKFENLKGKKIVIIHDLMSKIYPQNYSKQDLENQYNFFKFTKNADKIITVSESSKEDIKKYLNISSEKIEIINPGVDIDFFNQEIKNEKNIILKFNLPKKYILCLSNYRENKNLIGMIGAYSEYLSKTNDYDLKLVLVGGDDNTLKKIKKISSQLNIDNQIIFTGYISEEEKVVLYRKSFLFLFCSLYEGFGIPLLEAMAAGVPIITSNISSMPEVIENAGILVNPKKNSEIVNAIELIVKNSDLRNFLKNAGIERVKKFTWDESALKLKKIIETI